jgi:hypothetical protein
MSWEEICARCRHFTTIGYPALKERGEGRCAGLRRQPDTAEESICRVGPPDVRALQMG